MSYVGVVRTCLQADAAAFERAFPRVQMRVNTASAKGAPPSMGLKTTLALAGFIPRVMASGINGSYQQTPFFSTPTGLPAVPITVLSKAERAHAYSLA
jgi:hypothetical protein